MDRISNLQENLIGLILEKLSVSDRVMTSSLSRKWRLRWTFLSSLNLDFTFFCSISRKLRSRQLELEYAAIINSLVLQQRGNLKEFSLYMDLQPSNPLIPQSYQHVIRYVMGSNIVRLCLKDSGYTNFPFPTFSSTNLTHLEIGGLRLKASFRFEGLWFPNLTHLLFNNLKCSGVYISDFVSICPKLEDVRLVCVTFTCGPDIELNAPKLIRLETVRSNRLVSISNAEKLESLSMKQTYSFDEEVYPNIFNLFNHSTQLQHISLDGDICELLGSYRSIQMLARFDQLKNLEFHDMRMDDPNVFLSLLSLCRCSPNVRKLKLKLGSFYKSYVSAEAADPLEFVTMVENYINTDFGQLVKIELSGLMGTQVEEKIIEVLLRLSPVLDAMYIDFYTKVSENAKLQFLKHLLNLYRASNKTKFILLDD